MLVTNDHYALLNTFEPEIRSRLGNAAKCDGFYRGVYIISMGDMVTTAPVAHAPIVITFKILSVFLAVGSFSGNCYVRIVVSASMVRGSVKYHERSLGTLKGPGASRPCSN